MRLISSSSEFVVEYDSEKEYELNRPTFTLDFYEVARVIRHSENRIIVIYKKNEFD